LEFIANVLIGNRIDHYDFDILDHSNEQGGSANQSQTNSARLYNFTSNNDVLVSASVLNVMTWLIFFNKGSHPRHTRVSRHSRSSAGRNPQKKHCHSDSNAHRLC
jgi:hypothetical protein